MFPILLLTLAPLAQSPELTQGQAGLPELSIEAVQFHTYTPRHTDVDDLYNVAVGLIGRGFYVKERGGPPARPVNNLSMLGDAVLIYDEEVYARQVLELLAQLDREPQPSPADARPAIVTLEYRPKHVSIDQCATALQSHMRNVRIRASDGSVYDVPNVTVPEDRDMLLIRDFADEVRGMSDRLERIDVPAQQVTFTFHLIQAGGGGAGGELPAELAEGLAGLLPGRSFSPRAFALLRAGVTQGNAISVRLEDGNVSYDLSFNPAAFDPQARSVSVTRCRLLRDGVLLFSTDTTFVGGEHTVIGATGTEPTFLVVHLSAS